MQDPNPSDSPSVYICAGFTKAWQLAKENKKPTDTCPYPCRSQHPTTPILRSLTNTHLNVCPHTPFRIMLLTLLLDLNPNHARPTPCCLLNKLNLTYSWTRTWLKDISAHLNPLWQVPSSLVKRKMESYALSRTIASSIREPLRTSTPSAYT